MAAPAVVSRAPALSLDRRTLGVGLVVLVLAGFALFRGQLVLPHDDDYDLFRILNGLRDWVNQNRSVLEPVRAGIAGLVALFNDLLASLGWPGVIGIAAAVGVAFGSLRLGLSAGVCLALLGALGLWEPSMAVLAMTLAAVLLALLIGVPLGIWAGRNQRVAAFLSLPDEAARRLHPLDGP